MRKISDEGVCFVVSLSEVKKYGLSPLEQLKRNPEAKLLFPEQVKEVKNNVIKRNDLLRRSIPCVSPLNLLVLTRGVASLGQTEISQILNKVKDFNSFTKDNDPWGEHDFGAFEHNGRKFFWKIDDYGGHEGYNLILTVMLTKEY